MSYPRKYPISTGAPCDENDWNAMIDILEGFTPSGVFKSNYSFLVVEDGTDAYGCNAYQILYGGPDDVGGVDGADHYAVIQACLNAVSGTTKEVVILIGDFSIGNQLRPKSYTCIKLYGSITQTDAVTVRSILSCNDSRFEVYSAVTDLEIYGGRWLGGYTSVTWAGAEISVIYVNGGTRIKVDVDYVEGNGYGVFIDSADGHTSYDGHIKAYVTGCGTGIVNRAVRGSITGTCKDNINEGFVFMGKYQKGIGCISDGNAYAGILVGDTNAAQYSTENIELIGCSSAGDGGAGESGSITIINALHVSVVGGSVYDGGIHGLEIQASKDVVVDGGFKSYQNTQHGIELGIDGAETGNENVKLMNFSSYLNGYKGLVIYGGQKYCTVKGDIWDNGTALVAGERDGIHVLGLSTDDVERLQLSARCFDTRAGGARTQDQGIYLQTYMDEVDVVNCDLFDNITNNFVLAAAYGSDANLTNLTVDGKSYMDTSVANPAAGGSPYTYTNEDYVSQYVAVGGGTVSTIEITRGATQFTTGVTSGVFRLAVTDTITVTFTVAPNIALWNAY